MSSREAVAQWEHTVSQHLPHLSRPQAAVLARWSYGMLLARSCGTTLEGTHRAQIEVSTCFAPLLRWVLHWWPASEQRLALALDASTLSDRFTVLAISVLYRGCAIPVAWSILPTNAKGAWKPLWIELLHALCGAVPSDWLVIVLADRGLYARWLYEEIQSVGWHPYLRINQGGKACPRGTAHFHWLTTFIPEPGSVWSGQVRCFTQAYSRLDCTLLAHWEKDQKEPWLLVTDLVPEHAEVAWYAMRFWIECGFKDCKRGGWQWHQTKMTDPRRAERQWLVVAVATLWAVGVGGEGDATLSASGFAELAQTPSARQPAKPERRLSCFNRGIMAIVVALLEHRSPPIGHFRPFAWPGCCRRARSQTSSGAGP